MWLFYIRIVASIIFHPHTIHYKVRNQRYEYDKLYCMHIHTQQTPSLVLIEMLLKCLLYLAFMEIK